MVAGGNVDDVNSVNGGSCYSALSRGMLVDTMYRIVFKNVGTEYCSKDKVVDCDSFEQAIEIAILECHRVLDSGEFEVKSFLPEQYYLIAHGFVIGSFSIQHLN